MQNSEGKKTEPMSDERRLPPTTRQTTREMRMFKTLWKDEEGLTTVEYALLLALVAIAAITAWTTLGSRVSTTVSRATANLPTS